MTTATAPLAPRGGKTSAMPVFARQYAMFYDQLGRQLKAGLAPHVTIANVLNGPLPDVLRDVLLDARKRVEGGEAFADALGRHPAVIPRHEVRFMKAAEAAGMLPAACERLAREHKTTHERSLRVASKLVYPVVLLMAASVIAPAKIAFDGETGRYLATAVPPILALLGGVAAGVWVAFAPAAGPYRQAAYAFGMKVPPIAAALRQLALARAGGLMAMCFEAGLPADNVFKLVADATPDPKLKKACLGVASQAAKGKTLADAMEAQGGAFPGVMISVVRTGEESGKLDEALTKAGEFWQEDADRALDTLIKLTVGGLVGVAMLIVAFLILNLGLGMIYQLHTMTT